MVKIKFALVFLLISLILSSCAAPKRQPPATAEETQTFIQDTAQEYMTQGKYLDAALIYARMAVKAPVNEKPRFQLLAAEAMLRGNYPAQARQLLQNVDDTQLTESLRLQRGLLEAEILLAGNKAEQALITLDTVHAAAEDAQLRVRYWIDRADAYALTGNNLESAHARIRINNLIGDPAQMTQNQVAILKALSELSGDALEKLLPTSPTPTFRAWMELALLVKTSRLGQQQLLEQIDDWKANHPDIALQESVVDSLLYRQQAQLELPDKIALLLPLKGRFAVASQAIRDGFLAAYYQSSEQGFKPEILIYDTGEHAETIGTYYTQAVHDGAQMIVGPLDKTAVTLLAADSGLDIPVLALNYAEGKNVPASNFFQFGLSPEDEALQVAERAWLDGYQHPVVLFPQGTWGERVAAAFLSRWQQLGGEVLETQSYDSQANDFSLPIRMVLNIDESQRRRNELRRLLGTPLEFTPRRRQDADFIFIAGFPRQARLIRPQLKFHHASDLPVYATSHVYSGTIDRKQDQDMDGIRFGDMPWVLPKQIHDLKLKRTIEDLWPAESERVARFFALGIDTFNLIPKLNRLISIRSSYHDGETGQLFLDDFNRIYRRISWVEFKNGIPLAMDNRN